MLPKHSADAAWSPGHGSAIHSITPPPSDDCPSALDLPLILEWGVCVCMHFGQMSANVRNSYNQRLLGLEVSFEDHKSPTFISDRG